MIINFNCNEHNVTDSIIHNCLKNKKCKHSELDYCNTTSNRFRIAMKKSNISALFKVTKSDFCWKQIDILFIDDMADEYYIPECVKNDIKMYGLKKYSIKIDENKLYEDMLKILEYNKVLENQANVRRINKIVFDSYMETLKAKQHEHVNFIDKCPENEYSNLSFSISGFWFHSEDTYKYIHENDVENWNFKYEYFKFSIKQLVENKTNIIKSLRQFEKKRAKLENEFENNKNKIIEEGQAKIRLAGKNHSEKFNQLIQKTFPENLCDIN